MWSRRVLVERNKHVPLAGRSDFFCVNQAAKLSPRRQNNSGDGHEKISKSLNISWSTVKLVIKKLKEYGTAADLPRTSCPQNWSAQPDHQEISSVVPWRGQWKSDGVTKTKSSVLSPKSLQKQCKESKEISLYFFSESFFSTSQFCVLTI